MTTWATARLDALIAGAEPPPVVRTMRLGTLDAWRPGWARKRFDPDADQMNGDGSLFGGLIAALADQMLAFAAMTVVPGDHLFRTTNLTVSYFRLARREPIDIEARVVAQSRQLIHVRADFRNAAGDVMADAMAQQVLTMIGGAA